MIGITISYGLDLKKPHELIFCVDHHQCEADMSKRDGRIAQLHLQLQWDYLKQLLADSEEPAYYEATARAFLSETLLATEKNPVLDELNQIHCRY